MNRPAALSKLTSTDATAINAALRRCLAAAEEQGRLVQEVSRQLQAPTPDYFAEMRRRNLEARAIEFELATSLRMPEADLRRFHQLLDEAA